MSYEIIYIFNLIVLRLRANKPSSKVPPGKWEKAQDLSLNDVKFPKVLSTVRVGIELRVLPFFTYVPQKHHAFPVVAYRSSLEHQPKSREGYTVQC